ncbi:flagellar basal body-associated FliL family protein [Oceaniglobus indicus]|uniref:flagellar basal body-associated FliL family protein n=1 Tax=Oceaniglobus indicus TaxID=2047749 RepID=UPI000C195392|nr:flagellar basal body-associated FliL family protein [Oceaniglobus indicus]
MLAKLIPLIIGLAGLGLGVGAGVALRPPPPEPANEQAVDHAAAGTQPAPAAMPEPPKVAIESEFVAMSNQFVFPLVEDGDVGALVVLTLTLEVTKDQAETVLVQEPRLRDGFLRVMLDHANAGGFRGAFTANDSMDRLRNALIEKARETLGAALIDVLILDINRQDV